MQVRVCDRCKYDCVTETNTSVTDLSTMRGCDGHPWIVMDVNAMVRQTK
jgi:hypothetical protein